VKAEAALEKMAEEAEARARDTSILGASEKEQQEILELEAAMRQDPTIRDYVSSLKRRFYIARIWLGDVQELPTEDAEILG